jgi:hypothetical protein
MSSAKKLTAADVRKVVEGEVESDTPDAVLAVFQAHDGKPFTRRLLAKLPGGESEWHIHQIAGMTSVQNKAYGREGAKDGISLLIAYALKNITVDAKFLVERNAAYFAARVERNAWRAEMLAPKNAHKVVAMADVLNEVNAAKEKLRAAIALLETYTAHDGPFYADRYEFLTRVCGADLNVVKRALDGEKLR